MSGRQNGLRHLLFFYQVDKRFCVRANFLFVCLHRYLFVRGVLKESESHGAYQDMVRDVGAPHILLTDIAQTQIGAKWTKMSHNNVTQQIRTEPHNQKQNNTERKIQDIKRRLIMTLLYTMAPLMFWCYCMYFVVDCLNHTAQKELDYQTAPEKMSGQTPDISMFRLYFWETVWYYEPTAKYSKSNFLPGRFVGLAWEHGDAFTCIKSGQHRMTTGHKAPSSFQML
jgi:hypothetical protein